MARPKNDGLSYFPFDVSFFSDMKIKSVRAHFGADGVALYIYLLCEIYRNGYYVKADDDFIDCTASDLGLSVDKVRQLMKFFCKRSLFNDTLLTADTILTASQIQRRYQEARKGAKRDIFVDEKLWLLEKSETLEFIKVRPQLNSSEKNTGFSEKNPDFSAKNATKESKVNKRKVNESSTRASSLDTAALEADIWAKYGAEPPASAYNDDYDDTTIRPVDGIGRGVVMLSNQQIGQLLDMMSRSDFEEYVKRLAYCIADKGYTVRSHYNTICRWYKEDKGP